MKLSTQEEYGLRCLLQMARHGDARSVTIAELSRLEGISSPNVAKIMRALRSNGFVKSTRGQAGGYVLARPSDQINVGEVLGALGGRLFDSSFCDRHAGALSLCRNLPDCSIRPVLRQVQNVMDAVLGELTLKSLVCSEQDVRVAASPHAVPLPVLRPS